MSSFPDIDDLLDELEAAEINNSSIKIVHHDVDDGENASDRTDSAVINNIVTFDDSGKPASGPQLVPAADGCMTIGENADADCLLIFADCENLIDNQVSTEDNSVIVENKRSTDTLQEDCNGMSSSQARDCNEKDSDCSPGQLANDVLNDSTVVESECEKMDDKTDETVPDFDEMDRYLASFEKSDSVSEANETNTSVKTVVVDEKSVIVDTDNIVGSSDLTSQNQDIQEEQVLCTDNDQSLEKNTHINDSQNNLITEQEMIEKQCTDVSTQLLNDIGEAAASETTEQICDVPKCDRECIVEEPSGNAEIARSSTEQIEKEKEVANPSDVGDQDSTDNCNENSERATCKTKRDKRSSVVMSTHDISQDSGPRFLTESELQLGKVKPNWIADSDTISCMLCCAKFTMFLRRHHCRCCGRVLCAYCTNEKVALPYINDVAKLQRVCHPCFETLKYITEYEKNQESQKVNNSNTEAIPITASDESDSRISKSALKLRATQETSSADENRGNTPSTSANKRSVKFCDGVNPGECSSETETGDAGGQNTPKPKNTKRYKVSRRLRELRMEEESVCLLPKTENDELFIKNECNSIVKCTDVDNQIALLSKFEIVNIAVCRNLWCTVKLCKYNGQLVTCIVSSGMAFVGLDEIFMAWFCAASPQKLPIDFIWRIHEIYENSLTPQDQSADEEIGIRAVHTRVPSLHRSSRFAKSQENFAKDIMLFRPTIQNFDDLLVPKSTFLVATFVHQSEAVWATTIPQRLLYRLGLQASYYPTPIVNNFDRDAVYISVFDTTILKVFNDFRNWNYRMLSISGSVLSLRDNEFRLIDSLISGNRNMIAWGLDFNKDADSHLVCEQDESGAYSTQVFTCGTTSRKITGASFVIIDGALKNGNQTISVNVVEDGIVVRLRSSLMSSLISALQNGQNFTEEASAMKFILEWKEPPPDDAAGHLVSPVDGLSLIGNYQYGLKKNRILSSFYPIPGVADYMLRLVSVCNISKGKFAPLIQSKVFAISEQIAAQTAFTLVPFAALLVENQQRDLFLRVRITSDDAEYKVAPWPELEQEFKNWCELLDNQVAPGLFNICSYMSDGFHAELRLALISVQPLP